jgi:hypothetical protein
VPTLQPTPVNDLLPPQQRRVAIGLGVAVAALLLTAVLLWAHYGTTVFFEMIAAGIAACF